MKPENYNEPHDSTLTTEQRLKICATPVGLAVAAIVVVWLLIWIPFQPIEGYEGAFFIPPILFLLPAVRYIQLRLPTKGEVLLGAVPDPVKSEEAVPPVLKPNPGAVIDPYWATPSLLLRDPGQDGPRSIHYPH